jgi:hypothetical protein
MKISQIAARNLRERMGKIRTPIAIHLRFQAKLYSQLGYTGVLAARVCHASPPS